MKLCPVKLCVASTVVGDVVADDALIGLAP